MEFVFNVNSFIQNLKQLYSLKLANNKNLFEDKQVDFIICDNSEAMKNSKQNAFMLWLFQLHSHDSILILGNDNVFLLGKRNVLSFMSKSFTDYTLKDIQDKLNLSIHFIEINENDDVNYLNISRVIDKMEFHAKSRRIGVFSNVNDDSKWRSGTMILHKILLDKNWTLEDVDDHVSFLMHIKRKEELAIMQKGCRLSCQALSKCISLIIEFLRYENLEGNQSPTNLDIAQGVIKDLKNDRQFLYDNRLAIQFYHPPIVQSGGRYDLELKSASNEEEFKDDIIILSFGIRYQLYCTPVARTFIVYPNEDVEQNYLFLWKLRDFILDLLQDGAKLDSVYDITMQFVEFEKPQLAKNLTKSFGSVIGILPEDKSYSIEKNSCGVARENMTFYVTVGLDGLVDETKKYMKTPPHTYSLLLGDTVKVEKGKSATILSPMCDINGRILLGGLSSHKIKYIYKIIDTMKTLFPGYKS